MCLHNIIKRQDVIWCVKRPPKVGCCHTHKRAVKNIILIFFILLMAICTHATAGPKILFVKSGSAPVYDKIINAAQHRMDSICQSNNKKCIKPSTSITSINNKEALRSLVLNNKWDLIISIGNNSARQLNIYKTKPPILYSLIPSHSYRAIRKNSSSQQISAIYIDQPIKRQLQLIKSALPGKNRVGVMLGSYSGIRKSRLQQIMSSMGLKPTIVNVTPANIGSSLEGVYDRVDVLLAQPDPSVYNKKTVMNVLLSSYRHTVPVFGYSAAFVRSGATAAIYSSPIDIGKHIGDEIVKYVSDNKKLSPPAFPKYFSIGTNRRVIKSLNIRMPPSNKIKAEIMKAR